MAVPMHYSHSHSHNNHNHNHNHSKTQTHRQPSASLISRLRQPFFRSDKRWRWWHALAALLVFLGLVELVALMTGWALLQDDIQPGRIAVRQYPAMSYRHLNTSAPINLSSDTVVFHITEEFGLANTGSLGAAVTALAAAQQKSGLAQVSVVMPFYSFLKNKYTLKRSADLIIDIRDKDNRPVPIEFRVWKTEHVFATSPNATSTTSIPLYLIGPGNRPPFSQAFRAKNALHINSPQKGLPREWRDQYFGKAAAAFVAHRTSAMDEVSLFAPMETVARVDVVHLHGATTAYAAKHMRDRRDTNQLGPKPPVFVYTLHEYNRELQHAHSINSVQKFLDDPALFVNARTSNQNKAFLQRARQVIESQSYTHNQRVFLSGLAVASADMVTVASQSMASDMVQGILDVPMKEMMMDSLLLKAQNRRFFGVSHGINFDNVSPFTHPKLIQRGLSFPNHALNLIQQQSVPARQTAPTQRSQWTLGASPNDFVSTSKDRAKRFLVRRKLLSEEDSKRPMVLFTGTFHYSNGAASFEEAAIYFQKYNMRLVLLGQPGDYPFEKLEALQAKYPETVLILATPKEYRQWSVLCRAAADVLFVPGHPGTSLSAIEGMLYGASVLSTGSGSLRDILIDRPVWKEEQNQENEFKRDIRIMRNKETKIPTVASLEHFNAYLFDDKTKTSLEKAIFDLSNDLAKTTESKALREEYCLRMIHSAMALDWERPQGPMEEYMQVYEVALLDRKLPSLTQHVVEEEEFVLNRLMLQDQQL
ncbi:glycosyltransferase family 5 protein [Phycomyces blakesleeanus]